MDRFGCSSGMISGLETGAVRQVRGALRSSQARGRRWVTVPSNSRAAETHRR
jgi:hypothetical protein